MSKNFGHNDLPAPSAARQAGEDEAPAPDATPATDDVRGKAVVLAILGVPLLFVTPVSVFGALFIFVALLMLLFSPVLGAAERNGNEQARTGSATRAGCGLLLGILVATTVFGLIAVLGAGALTLGGL